MAVEPNSSEATLQHQFNDAGQQREAATLGMWVFLATEILFLGALFMSYTVYRFNFPQAFMEASRHTLVWIGAINTGVLLLSSSILVLGVHAIEANQRALARRCLFFTASLGALFLVLKAFEYDTEIHEGLFPGRHFHLEGPLRPQLEMFFYLYFVLTGIHAIHVLVGVVLLSVFAVRLKSSSRSMPNSTAVDLLALYWHFVDIVWVFLFPLIYLAGRHG